MEMPVDDQFTLKTEVEIEDHEELFEDNDYHSEETLGYSKDEEKLVVFSEMKDNFSHKCEYKEKLLEDVGVVLFAAINFLKPQGNNYFK